MAGKLRENTATIIFKLPQDFEIPPFQEKIRAKKTLVRHVTQILRNSDLELLYVGYKPETYTLLLERDAGSATIICIHILEADSRVSNFQMPFEVLLKRFKREVQYNNEHILIDTSHGSKENPKRVLEIYIKNRNAIKALRGDFPFNVRNPAEFRQSI